MKVTIGTHNGTAVGQSHNRRDAAAIKNQAHIQEGGVYEVWWDEPITDAYHRLFDQSLKEYNARQKNPDRQIPSYYQHIKKDKKRNVAYEMIIGIYGKKDGKYPCPNQLGKEIMKEFVDTWKERNPNLELIGAYYHADEDGAPHVHIDYIPIGHGYKNGLSTQNGLNQAFKEMGIVKKGKFTAQMLWQQQQNKYFSELCAKRGLEVVHPGMEGRENLEMEVYKAQKGLETITDNYSFINNLYEEIKADYEVLEGKKEQLEGVVKSLEELKKQKAGRTILGTPKKEITLDYKVYLDLERTARAVKDVKKLQEELNTKQKELEKVEENTRKLFEQARFEKENIDRLINEKVEYREKCTMNKYKEYIAMQQQEIEDMEHYLSTIRYSNGRTALEIYKEILLERDGEER